MTTRPRVFYVDPPWLVRDGRLDPALATVEAEVLGSGVDVDFGVLVDGRYQLGGDDLVERVRDTDVLVVYRCPVTADLVDAAGDRLRAVLRQGVGVDNLNAGLLAARGLAGYNVPDYCVDEVVAHTTALALALERGLIPQHRTLAGGRFDIYAGGRPRRVHHRTLGIVGFGRIGRAVASRLGAHYGRVLVYDPYLGRDLADGYSATAVATLEELLGEADLITLHCPLTEETEHLIDERALAAMKPDAYLVNAARGRLVDPAALGRALTRNRLAGAGLDVFAPENPHDDPVWRPVIEHPRVVVSSHRAFLSVESEASSRRRVAELARDILADTNPVVGLVTAAGGPR
jgi:phosphoglycerate dehydrogenase-like enzyme